ncbi:MAG: hypothetical protein KAS94_00790 [Desulfobulbaceae bacterium]|nr:hypothetical protein [Desulfobulbaceae bacterium]
MNKAIKAALLSALLFPGAGHLLLKKYVAAVILAGASVASLYFLVATAIEKALRITEKIQRGEVPLDVAAIAELITNQTTGPEAQLLNIATAVLFIAWLIGIIDSYRVGCGQE